MTPAAGPREGPPEAYPVILRDGCNFRILRSRHDPHNRPGVAAPCAGAMRLLRPKHVQGLQIPAIKLAAAWRDQSLAAALQNLAAGEKAGGEQQRQAITSRPPLAERV